MKTTQVSSELSETSNSSDSFASSPSSAASSPINQNEDSTSSSSSFAASNSAAESTLGSDMSFVSSSVPPSNYASNSVHGSAYDSISDSSSSNRNKNIAASIAKIKANAGKSKTTPAAIGANTDDQSNNSISANSSNYANATSNYNSRAGSGDNLAQQEISSIEKNSDPKALQSHQSYQSYFSVGSANTAENGEINIEIPNNVIIVYYTSQAGGNTEHFVQKLAGEKTIVHRLTNVANAADTIGAETHAPLFPSMQAQSESDNGESPRSHTINFSQAVRSKTIVGENIVNSEENNNSGGSNDRNSSSGKQSDSISSGSLENKKILLVFPTYSTREQVLPPPVEAFIGNPTNRERVLGIVGAGDRTFGGHYCIASRWLAKHLSKPLLHTFEYHGTKSDVTKVKTEVISLLEQDQIKQKMNEK